MKSLVHNYSDNKRNKVFKESGKCIKDLHTHNCPIWNEVYEFIPTLNHPIIPQVYSCDKNGYEMEWVEGEALNLYHFNKRSNTITTQDNNFVLQTVSIVADFFSYCQSITKTIKGKQCYLVPTDCTPQNMVVTQDKKVYLIDLDQLQFFSAPKNSLKYYKHFLKEYLRIT